MTTVPVAAPVPAVTPPVAPTTLAAPVATITQAPTIGQPGAVTSLSANVTGTTVTLKWTNPSNAQGDSIYKDGGWIAGPGAGVNPPAPVVRTLTDVNVVAGSHTYAWLHTTDLDRVRKLP